MLKTLSNGSLLSLRLGQYAINTQADLAFYKQVEFELVQRGIISLVPNGTQVHWGKISEEARHDISEWFRDEIWALFYSELCRWRKDHGENY
jgi:hypothetical protein